jgi:hypothetical protein
MGQLSPHGSLDARFDPAHASAGNASAAMNASNVFFITPPFDAAATAAAVPFSRRETLVA